jgi:hypothetical protein
MSSPLDRDLDKVTRPESWSSDPVAGLDRLDPACWTCLVCGKVRARELLHSKAILGQQQLVCAPSCLEAERRANAR